MGEAGRRRAARGRREAGRGAGRAGLGWGCGRWVAAGRARGSRRKCAGSPRRLAPNSTSTDPRWPTLVGGRPAGARGGDVGVRGRGSAGAVKLLRCQRRAMRRRRGDEARHRGSRLQPLWQGRDVGGGRAEVVGGLVFIVFPVFVVWLHGFGGRECVFRPRNTTQRQPTRQRDTIRGGAGVRSTDLAIGMRRTS